MGWRLTAVLRLAPRTVALSAVALVCLVALPLRECGDPDLARAEGFAAAAAHLRELAPDFVVVWPPHVRGLGALPAELRAADAVPSEPPERRRYTRIAVIGPAGYEDPPEVAGATISPRVSFGDVEVGLYTHAVRDRVLFDLRAELASVRVSLRQGDDEVVCDQPHPGGGVGCPGRPEWSYVGPTSIRVEGREWPCVWAHPATDHELRLALGRRSLGDVVEVNAALSDSAALTRGGAPVEIAIEIDGDDPKNDVVRRLRRSNAAGIVTATVALPVAGDQGTVTLVVTTRDDGRRHLGLDARIIERRDADRPGGERLGADRPGDERLGAERPSAERPSDERPGDERPGAERLGAERPGAERGAVP